MQKATANFIKELKKQKRNGDLLFLDNFKIIKDALSNGVNAKYILLDREDKNIFGQLDNIFLTDSKTIEMLSDSKTPQGVVCVADYPQHTAKLPKNNFLVLDGLQDPGNVGTLIRSAYASGFNDIFLVDSVNITNTKLIRSSVGAIFMANVIEMTLQDFVTFAEKHKLHLIKADMDGKNIFEYKPTGNIGVVIGNEGQGVSEKISKLCVDSVKIPMQKGIESLNAAVSGSIIMYQINKKRLSR